MKVVWGFFYDQNSTFTENTHFLFCSETYKKMVLLIVEKLLSTEKTDIKESSLNVNLGFLIIGQCFVTAWERFQMGYRIYDNL